MRDLKKQQFDAYPNDTYLKSNEKAVKYFKEIKKFEKALGFDSDSGGFIVLHKKHKPSGIVDEIPVCLVLKKLGFDIVLIEEYDYDKSLDVEISKLAFEIKRLVNAENFRKAILRHFQRTVKKTTNLILHIDQPIYESQLKSILQNSAGEYSKIKIVWLIYESKLHILDRKMLLTKDYRLNK